MALFRINTCCRCLAVLLAGSINVFATDSVIVSKPDAALATPKASNPALLPSAPNDVRTLNFVQPPQPATPYIPPPIVRSEPRKVERRGFFDEPEMFSDKSKERDADENLFERAKERTLGARPLTTPQNDFSRDESERALSPIWDFNSKTLNSATRRNDTRRMSPFDDSVETDRSAEGIWLGFKPEKDRERADEISRFGFFTATPKRESARDDRERRAELDRLLNNNFSPLGPKNPLAVGNNISPLEVAKPTPPAPLPNIATPGRRSLDPMQAYEDQQRSWRGPSVDDLTRKVLGVNSQPASRPQPVDTRPSLMRQPTVRDFPARSF